MNERQKDKGLMKAVKREPQFRLPSNFTLRTMQKVEEAARLREKRAERRTLFAIITVSLLLIAGTCIGGYLYYGETIARIWKDLSQTGETMFALQMTPLYLMVSLSILLSLFFDRWMRKQYFKHHSL